MYVLARALCDVAEQGIAAVKPSPTHLTDVGWRQRRRLALALTGMRSWTMLGPARCISRHLGASGTASILVRLCI